MLYINELGMMEVSLETLLFWFSNVYVINTHNSLYDGTLHAMK